MRVLGIDPGSTITGYGVIERLAGSTVCIDCGTIRGGKGSLPDRLVAIDDGFRAVIEEFSPTAIAIENAFLGQNVKALAVMSQTRGVLLLAARRADLPVHEYAPREVKRSVVGNGGASKSQVAYMVGSLLGLGEVDLPPDATDSLAVALCHLHRDRVPTASRHN